MLKVMGRVPVDSELAVKDTFTSRPRSWQGVAWCLAMCGLLLVLMPQAQARTLLVVGDSISAGYGLEAGQGWVDLLAQRLAQSHPQYQVVNASISGDTNAGGLARLPHALREQRPAVVVLELGGNDGLRGQPLAQIQRNLASLVQQAKASGARVLLLGMRLPPNYGPRYTDGFAQIFGDVASAEQIPLVPFLLDGVGGVASLMQADGVHPRANAQQRLLDNAWPELLPLLEN